MQATPAPAPRRLYVDGPSGQVHVRDTGGARTPLLILHQSPTSSLDWVTTFPAFVRGGQRVIAPDNPGMGLSDPPGGQATMRDYVDSAVAVLDQLEVERAHLLGHHTGAQVATELAAAHPERVAKLVFYGAPVLTERELEALWTDIVPAERDGQLLQPAADGGHLLDFFQRMAEVGGPQMAQRNLHAILTVGPRYWEAHNAALTHDMRPALAKVRVPILFISHEGEMLHRASIAAQAAQPGAALALLQTRGPSALDSDPESLVATVMAFLQTP